VLIFVTRFSACFELFIYKKEFAGVESRADFFERVFLNPKRLLVGFVML
jgi:hypothetical protein